MPSSPLVRYALDPTGTNSDNAVSGEIKTLTVAQLRAVAPAYGPFFSESLAVYDHSNGALLHRGTDYKIVDLLQSATLRFGKEIAQVILIVNQNVSSQVRLNYQVLGGLFQNNAEGLANLYNTFTMDDRAVDWTEVLNKPTEYTPTLHRHMLEDVYGFEPVVVALERIRNAMVLSDVPAFESLIEWVRANSGNSVLTDPPLVGISSSKTKYINVFTTNNRNGTKYYWSIDHHSTNNNHFVTLGGELTIFQNRACITLETSATGPSSDRHFDIIIRKDRVDGPIATTIEGVTYQSDANSTMTLINACCPMEPGITINPKSFFLTGG